MTARVQRELSITALLVCAAIACVSAVRGRLFATHQRVKEAHDINFLPPPSQVKVMALGYEAALADMLWAHVLVSQGLHLTERRRFENIARLYDVINELDPKWRTPYLLAEALITLQSVDTGMPEVLATRRILERGVENRPLDAELWLDLGTFVAFSAPPTYMDAQPELKKQWKLEGAAYLARAAELGAGDAQFGWQVVGGADMLKRMGQREDAVRFYERLYATSDDPDLRAEIEHKLKKLLGGAAVGRAVERRRKFDELRQKELPWMGETTLLMIGPRARLECAGLDAPRTAECATSWRAWADRVSEGH